MAYSTGSGDYTALMNAVLTHAVADGWTEDGGVGTGWPLVSPSGRIRGVDWDTYTATENDHTLGGDGLSKTQRYIRLGLGTSGANATANASSGPKVPNMAYTFTTWYIFSDIASGEWVHVVYNFSNGASSDCYGHFSFGEVDKGGLTYHSIAYVTTSDRRGYAESTEGGEGVQSAAQGGDWNTLNRTGNMWAGNWGENDDGWGSVGYMTHATTAPHPNGVAGWPATDSFITAGANLWASNARSSDVLFPGTLAENDGGFHSIPWTRGMNSQTGFVPLGPIPFIMINGSISTSRLRWMGSYPQVRFCRMDGVNPGDEFSFGADTWKLFPVLRSTEDTLTNQSGQVTSGRVGYAYKKVP